MEEPIYLRALTSLELSFSIISNRISYFEKQKRRISNKPMADWQPMKSRFTISEIFRLQPRYES